MLGNEDWVLAIPRRQRPRGSGLARVRGAAGSREATVTSRALAWGWSLLGDVAATGAPASAAQPGAQLLRQRGPALGTWATPAPNTTGWRAPSPAEGGGRRGSPCGPRPPLAAVRRLNVLPRMTVSVSGTDGVGRRGAGGRGRGEGGVSCPQDPTRWKPRLRYAAGCTLRLMWWATPPPLARIAR